MTITKILKSPINLGTLRDLKTKQIAIAAIAWDLIHIANPRKSPHLIITGPAGETFTAKPHIIFGDFNLIEQFSAIDHYNEITSIGFTSLGQNGETRYYPLSYIKSIELTYNKPG